MKQINEKQIDANGVILNFDICIKKIIEFDNCFVVLIREGKEVPNNIIAYDYQGKEWWKINDIVKAKISRGYDDIEKMQNGMLKVNYELGIVYEIDLNSMKIINEIYMR